MRVYIDTNVVIDLLANRAPYADDAKKIFLQIADKKIIAYISASAFTDIYYITKKMYRDEQMTRRKMIDIMSLLEITHVMSNDVKIALDTKLSDYEDGLIEEIAYNEKLDYIITRNKKDFKISRVEALTPKEFLKK